jgi:hypothetical protein
VGIGLHQDEVVFANREVLPEVAKPLADVGAAIDEESLLVVTEKQPPDEAELKDPNFAECRNQ